MIFAFKRAFSKILLLLTLVCSLSFGLISFIQPSYAAPETTLANPDQMPDPAQAYEEAKQIAKDPKMGAEKAYEKEVKVFQEEHPDENIVEKSKEVVETAKGK